MPEQIMVLFGVGTVGDPRHIVLYRGWEMILPFAKEVSEFLD